jgi:pimeloyl-ACP methyl ester carboxylesterase
MKAPRLLALVVLLWATHAGSLAGQVGRDLDVRVDDLTLYLSCRGVGSPTVVFESGAEMDSAVWGLVRQRLARTMRACVYDRAGMGRSGGPAPRSALDVTRQFWSMLDAAGIDDPIVLVGHSLGAYLVRIHAGGRPNRVVGMVLVDPETEAFYERAKAFMPVEDWIKWGQSEGDVREFARLAVPPNGPVRILSSGQTALAGGPGYQVEELRNAWREAHAQYALSLPNGRQSWLPNSGHFIQLDNPAAIVSEIMEVLRTAPSR